MLITACLGLACNIINMFALNADCGTADDDEDEDSIQESEITARTGKSFASRSLAKSLMSVYTPK